MINIEVAGVDYEVPSSAADTNWAAKQVAFEQALAAGITDLAAQVAALEEQLVGAPWVPLTLENDWANIGGQQATASQLSLGVVRLRLAVQSGSLFVVGTLPSGHRPPSAVAFQATVIDTFGDAYPAHLSVQSSGEVMLFPMAGSNPALGTYFEGTFSITPNTP